MEQALEPQRLIAFDSVFNFRDLGGYTAAGGGAVRRGTIFRADGLHRLGPSDLARFAGLGIRTVVDLRTEGERVQWGGVDPHGTLTVHHLPLLRATWEQVRAEWAEPEQGVSPAEFLHRRYVDMLGEGRHCIAATLELLADPAGHPVVFHCTAGKDRTGVVAAVVLCVLGVAEQDVVDDYALSAPAMVRLAEWFRLNVSGREGRSAPPPAAMLAAPPDAMRLLLSYVRERFGSMEGYAASIGVGPSTVAELRRQLVA